MIKSILDDFEHGPVTIIGNNGKEFTMTGFRKFEFVVAVFRGKWLVFHLPSVAVLLLHDFKSAESGAEFINKLLLCKNDWSVINEDDVENVSKLIHDFTNCNVDTEVTIGEMEKTKIHAAKYNPNYGKHSQEN